MTGAPIVRGSPVSPSFETYVDLPTSHWPMWSRPQELAAIIGDVALERGPSG